jgi:hypothetical protein
MEKSEILRTRVTQKLKRDFEEICKAYGNKPPAEMLREVVETFVQSNFDRLNDRVVVQISRPEGYMFGAWRVVIKLRNPEDATWKGSAIPFNLPKFEKRNLTSDIEFQSVVGVPNNENFVNYELGGTFIAGEWRGHLYTNGVEEQDNLMTIDQVQSKLVDYITKHLDRFK